MKRNFYLLMLNLLNVLIKMLFLQAVSSKQINKTRYLLLKTNLLMLCIFVCTTKRSYSLLMLLITFVTNIISLSTKKGFNWKKLVIIWYF